LADFDRGIKAGLATGVVYLLISVLLSAIYQDNPMSVPYFIWGSGLTLFAWSSLTDPSEVISLLFQYVVRGIVFGAVFAALYSLLPGTASVKKGVVLSAFLCIVALVGVIYTSPGWPANSWVPDGAYYIGMLNLSSFRLGLAGIISALVFGTLTGFLWDRFRGRELREERKGRSLLLLSFIMGGAIWALLAVVFLAGVAIIGEVPAIEPGFWWFGLLNRSVVFLGLPGWVLALLGWKKTRVDRSGFRWGLAGGVLMALTGLMLLPGFLAIIGGVLSRRKAADESGVAAVEP
jgi:hypothetical protein